MLFEPRFFNWTTTEQLWPFETANGAPIYAKYVTVALGNTTTVDVAHNITGLLKVLSAEAVADNGASWRPVPFAVDAGTSTLVLLMSGTNVSIITYADFSAYSADVYLRYTKS